MLFDQNANSQALLKEDVFYEIFFQACFLTVYLLLILFKLCNIFLVYCFFDSLRWYLSNLCVSHVRHQKNHHVAPSGHDTFFRFGNLVSKKQQQILSKLFVGSKTVPSEYPYTTFTEEMRD